MSAIAQTNDVVPRARLLSPAMSYIVMGPLMLERLTLPSMMRTKPTAMNLMSLPVASTPWRSAAYMRAAGSG